jgi:hypothetical protein
LIGKTHLPILVGGDHDVKDLEQPARVVVPLGAAGSLRTVVERPSGGSWVAARREKLLYW